MKNKNKETEIKYYPDLNSCVENEKTSYKLRKSTHTLKITASGCILFGIWSLIRMILMFVADKNRMTEFLRQFDEEGFLEEGSPYFLLTYILVCVILLSFSAFIMAIYLAIGVQSFKQANGKKMNPIFVILVFLAIAMEVYSVYSIVMNLYEQIGTNGFTIFDEFASVMMSVAFVVTLLDLFVAAIRVQHFRRVLRKKETVKEVA